jgi:IS5 family transposase
VTPTRLTQHGPNTSSAVQMLTESVATNPVRQRAAGRLEPCAGKLACTVLRGGHAGNGVSLPDGKSRNPYEFGVKVGIATTLKGTLIVGARAFPGNPYDGHTLNEQVEQATILMQALGAKPQTAFVDLGYRGVDKDNLALDIKHRGKFNSLTDEEKKSLKRRQAIEPIIGHLKADHRMNRCHLKGSIGDSLHAVLCAAGFNIRWLLRMIAKKGIDLFLRLLQASGMGHIGRQLREIFIDKSAKSGAMRLALA